MAGRPAAAVDRVRHRLRRLRAAGVRAGGRRLRLEAGAAGAAGPDLRAPALGLVVARAGGDSMIDQLREQVRGLPGVAGTAAQAAPLRVLQVGVGNTITMVPLDSVLYVEAVGVGQGDAGLAWAWPAAQCQPPACPSVRRDVAYSTVAATGALAAIASWRLTALSTALNEAVTILLSMPAPNRVGPLARRSST
jgi:hypothetical protein